MEKLKTLFWFVARPHLYRQFVYQIKQSLFKHEKEDTRDEAINECKNRAKSYDKLFSELEISTIVNYKDEYKTQLSQATKIESTIPVIMGGGGDGQLLFNLIMNEKPNTVIETGVAYGWSSLAILLALDRNKSGKLYSTDMPYAKMNNEDYVGVVIPKELRDHWSLTRLPDRQALPKILKEHSSIDFVHYDSDKSYRGRKWAYPLLWNHLNIGGLLVSDDINDNMGFFDFAKSLKKEPLVIEFEGKYIGILRKSS